MNPALQPPVKPLPGQPASQTHINGLPLLQKRSVRIINNTQPPRGKPRGFGPTRSLVATYSILSDDTFDGLAAQVQKRVVEGLTVYGAPMTMGGRCAQCMVTWL